MKLSDFDIKLTQNVSILLHLLEFKIFITAKFLVFMNFKLVINQDLFALNFICNS